MFKLRPIKLVFGDPIPYSDIEDMDEDQMAEYVGAKIAECYEQAREWNSK